ncbi:hypothetical protein ACFOW4_29915 [Micromonospora sp. GCM10011542]|uniref:hypothetical protein n=1 Tax=Micromonospora sp. GCM10011542 TaxID=3317337 RepID=UPI00360CEB39
MELRRSRGALVLPLVCVLAGVVLLALPRDDALLRTLVAVGAILLGVVALLAALRPFRFRIDADGLTVRRPGLRRQIPWAEVEALVLDRPPARDGRPAPPRLLLVPPPGGPATARHPVDGRPAVELLDLDQVRQKPEQVAEALTRFAGNRFVDLPARRRAAFPDPDFGVGLRGCRMDRVDELIRRGQDALLSGVDTERRTARAEIERAQAEGLPAAQRGYDRRQVDQALSALADALASDRSADRSTP